MGFSVKVYSPDEIGPFWLNLIKLDQSVSGLQIVGLVLSNLQVMGLNCSRTAICGTKIIYTSK
jgi:hypothetical protein